MKTTKQGILYKVTNKRNGMTFIGLTSSPDGIRDNKSRLKKIAKQKSADQMSFFEKSVASEGFDNFKWETIGELENIELLKKKRRTYIEEERKKRNSYNIRTRLNKEIVQYSLQGDFIQSFDSSVQVEEKLGFNRRSVRQCCLKNTLTSHGFIFLHKEKYNSKSQQMSEVQARILAYEKTLKKQKAKKVTQFDLNGVKIGEHESPKKASTLLNIPRGSIKNNCLGNILTCHGFVFLYPEHYVTEAEMLKEVHARIKQYKKYIATFTPKKVS